MKTALIGYSGFVGETLLRQTSFDSLYRSTNIHEIKNKSFDTIVCAGAPAQKWLANQDPSQDQKKIDQLISFLKTVTAHFFILISTVDVFENPNGVNEDSNVDESNLHAYGLHRRKLEKFVKDNFSNHLIVRLPGLIGPGLRKNIIFDILNNHNLNTINGNAVYQFYPMVNLWYDISVARASGLHLVHLTAEPISVNSISQLGFDRDTLSLPNASPIRYDMQTKYADIFSTEGLYQYNQRETILAVRAYAQSEPLTISTDKKGKA